MALLGGRVRALWRRTAALGWPVALQQTLNTLMRTTDVLVSGVFSPAAVAAIGLADLYARLPLRVGMGLGSGALALSSQETGRAADRLRDRAITQALLLGVLAGLPLTLVGLLFSRDLVALLGANAEVARLGGLYLLLVLAVAPMRILGLVGASALQGTGDTLTPMVINGGTAGLNVVLTVALGLGLAGAPRLGIVGVGLATAVSRTVEAALVVGVIASGRRGPALARPRDATVTRQLLAVSVPDVAGGLSTEVASFPFNALLLTFGTEVTAAYHIASRVYQQVSAPLFRAFRTVASILVGQALGAGEPDEARRAALGVTGLSLAVLTAVGLLLLLGAEPLVVLFTRDPTTVEHAAAFVRAFAVALVFVGVYFPLSGALRGAGDTRTPFYAGLVGSWGFLLGASYLLAVVLGFGLVGVYAGLVLAWASRAVVVGAGLWWGDWAGLAAGMIAERAALDDDGSGEADRP